MDVRSELISLVENMDDVLDGIESMAFSSDNNTVIVGVYGRGRSEGIFLYL